MVLPADGQHGDQLMRAARLLQPRADLPAPPRPAYLRSWRWHAKWPPNQV